MQAQGLLSETEDVFANRAPRVNRVEEAGASPSCSASVSPWPWPDRLSRRAAHEILDSPGLIAGIAENLPNTQIPFDKFHIVRVINQAVDAVRRAEHKSRAELKKSRYLWLKNPHNLSKAVTHSAGQPLGLKPQDRTPRPPRLLGALPPACQERRGVPQEMGHP